MRSRLSGVDSHRQPSGPGVTRSVSGSPSCSRTWRGRTTCLSATVQGCVPVSGSGLAWSVALHGGGFFAAAGADASAGALQKVEGADGVRPVGAGGGGGSGCCGAFGGSLELLKGGGAKPATVIWG